MFIILPTYNERENIEKILTEIFSLGIKKLKIVIVDDNSPDGTGKIVGRLKNKYSLEVIRREKKMGLGSAYIAGFKYALSQKADLIMTMDADFSHDPRVIPNFIKTAKDGFAVVVGSRRVSGGEIRGWNWWRKFSSWGAMTFSRAVLGLKTRDVTTGYRCYHRRVLENIDLDKIKSSGYAFQEEMIYLSETKGFKVKEIPIIFIDRQKGKSKLSWWEIVRFFVIIFKLKFK